MLRIVPAAFGALLLTIAVPWTPAAAFHTADPIVLNDTIAGSGAWGLRIGTTTGAYVLDLLGTGPAAGSQISAGIFVTNAAGAAQFGFAFTGHLSPDRLIVTGTSTTGTPPPGLELSVGSLHSDAPCTYFCLGANFNGAPGTSYLIVWMGGVQSTTLEVRGTGVTAVASAGTAHVLGDPEISAGTPNVQVQRTQSGAGGVGVKVMRDAAATIAIQNRVYGFWGASDFKLACAFVAGVCVWKSTVDYTADNACRSAAGASCATTRLSWSGPAGSGYGYPVYALMGGSAGSYRFQVDLKVDAYTTASAYIPEAGLFVLAAENYSYLTIADAALPP